MVIDETQCQAVLDAERRNGRQIVVTFNYRYAPRHQRVKELLMAGEIGTVTSVDSSWYLDTSHGADYFRRRYRLAQPQRVVVGAQGDPPLRPVQHLRHGRHVVPDPHRHPSQIGEGRSACADWGVGEDLIK